MLPEEPDAEFAADLTPRANPLPGAIGRRVRIAAIIVAATLALAFALVEHYRLSSTIALARAATERTEAKVPVNAVRVSEVPADQSLALPGSTAAWYESTIYSRVNGYVAKWSADIGDAVQKGQVLAMLATPELDAELAAARARLEADRAQVKVRESGRDFAHSTFDRWRDSPKGVVSEQEREAKKADFVAAQAQLNASRASVDLDRAEVERLTTLTRFKEVIAPFNGIVIERHIDIGNLVTAGSSANTVPLYTIVQDDPIRVYVDVPQSAAESIGPGTTATVIIRDQDGRKLAAKVARTARAIEPVARTVRVEIDLPNPDHKLVPGLYVQVDFGLKSQGFLQIPAAALLFRSGGPQVAVIGADGAIAFRDVVIARDQGDVIDLASGLQAGEMVALNLSSQVAAGDKVEPRVQPAAAPATIPSAPPALVPAAMPQTPVPASGAGASAKSRQ